MSSSARFSPWHKSPIYRYDPTPLSDPEDKRVLRGSRPALDEHDPEELHRRGLLWLYQGEAARAVSALEAVAERKSSAGVLSDLAAAYLALAEDDRPWLRVDAIAAATRAVERAPDDPSAAFNLALALERTSLAYEAELAWERYRKLESDEGWLNEAAQHLARLREPKTTDRWKNAKGRLVPAAAAGDRATLSRLARQFPRQVKEYLEAELFPAWADAVGTPAERSRLIAVKGVADVLASSGERLYADAIGAIEKRAAAVSALAEGHRAYAEGLALRGDCSQAARFFEHSREQFSATGSPMAKAARYQELVCIYRNRPADAEESLAELASELETQPYPTLLARTEGIRGLCEMAHGQHSKAIAHYERAIQLLRNSGDTDVLNLLGMLDEACRFLGDREREWGYRLESLKGAVAAGDRRLRHAVLAGLARELVEKDRREVARVVLDEMLANARAWSEPGAEAEALLRRIQLGILSGSDESAAADIVTCSRLLEQYRQPADRERLETELILASAEQQLATKPDESLKAFQAVVPQLEASGDGLLLPRALLGLARARASVGDSAEAEEAFDRALRIYEAHREGTVGEEHRISFFATVQASFDAMIRFQAFERRDARAAFAYSERVRARALRDRVAESGAKEPLPFDEQIDHIPVKVAVLAYTELPEALLVWRLQKSTLKMYTLPVARSQVADVVGSFRAAMTGARSLEAGQAAAAKAFDLLLRSALEGVPVGTELVFLPDRELYQVPFSALFDASRRRYLIEDHACSVSPSLELYLASQERSTSASWKPRRVLSVGDPAFDRARFPDLPRLPSAQEEALAVAALYKEAPPIVGPDATRQRILESLPESDVLHLAAHVVVDPRSSLDSLVATAGPGGEPLRASDLNAERLAKVRLVFLAACDTAPGFNDGDREGTAGLARAFLASGIPSVVATLWAVDDQAAARLATAFHTRLLQGESPARALRLSQLAFLSEPSSSAPFAWAPFQLFQGP
ncbi:MAG: CHAT domain-containing protein [Acidobacteriota bacterium]